MFSILIRRGEGMVFFPDTRIPTNTKMETKRSEPEWKASASKARLPESTAKKSFSKIKRSSTVGPEGQAGG